MESSNKVLIGSAEAMADSCCIVELKETIEKMDAELSQSRTKISELDTKVREQAEAAQKEISKLQEENARIARDLKESEEKCRAVQERLEFAEQKLDQFSLVQVNETNDDALKINSLPNEIILEVFSYLDQNQLSQTGRVCKRWNVLSKNPVLWKKVNVQIFSSCKIKTINSFINGLPSCVSSISLDLMEYDESFYFEEICPRLQEKCPHLEELTLIHPGLSVSLPAVIGLCSEFLQDVKKLIFQFFTFLCDRSTDECSGVAKIEVLELFDCYFHSYNGSPFSKLPHLKQLHLHGTFVPDSWFEDDASFLNQLHVLNVGRNVIDSRIFSTIQNNGLNLRELYCMVYLKDHDLNINNLAFPNLKAICLSDSFVTCEGVVSLIQSCPSLENVYVNEDVAESFAVHPFVVANRSKSGIVKAIQPRHYHNYLNALSMKLYF